jgi:CheY-like chemotaxis protein
LLVADDQEANCLVLAAQLKRLGHAADFVSNGAEALAALGRSRYAALLTDCHMPEMDGFELTRRVRGGGATGCRELAIIAVTAASDRDEVRRCLAAGMNDVLVKPVTLAGLREVLARWLPPIADDD